MFDPHFDRAKRRLHIRYTGFWTPDDAVNFLHRFRATLADVARSGGSFTLLDDLRDWPTQSREVAEVTNEFVNAVHAMPVSRNAMIIPQPLLRMQVSRTLKDLDNCLIFETYEQADSWLAEVEPPNAA